MNWQFIPRVIMMSQSSSVLCALADIPLTVSTHYISFTPGYGSGALVLLQKKKKNRAPLAIPRREIVKQEPQEAFLNFEF